MKTIAIIAEYNPLHNGHLYQVNKIKKEIDQAYLIGLVSGSFVQRGEPSFMSKYDKAKAACRNGLDLVLEMPTIISLQSAHYFAKYSVSLLQKLNIVDYLSFGIEGMEKEDFLSFMDFERKNRQDIDELTKSFIAGGLSYKIAYDKAIASLYGESQISKANNTLALEYMRALEGGSIKPLPIKRVGAGYDDDFTDHGYQSATAIRNQYGKTDLSAYMPQESLENIEDFHRLDDYGDIFFYLTSIVKKDPSDTANYEDGMLDLIMKNMGDDFSIEAALEKSHNKRYSRARLRRFVLNYILDISREDVKGLDQVNFIRPLAFNDRGRKILRQVNPGIEILSKYSDSYKLDSYNRRLDDLDKEAFKLYNIRNKKRIKLIYESNPYLDKF